MADSRSSDRRIVDGLREFYLGYLSKHLPMEAFDRVRRSTVTDVAMHILRDIRAEVEPPTFMGEPVAHGVQPSAAPQPWENAAAYEAWLHRHWPDNAQARAMYHSEMNTRAAFVAGAEWERTRGVKGEQRG